MRHRAVGSAHPTSPPPIDRNPPSRPSLKKATRLVGYHLVRSEPPELTRWAQEGGKRGRLPPILRNYGPWKTNGKRILHETLLRNENEDNGGFYKANRKNNSRSGSNHYEEHLETINK
eukprot:GHVT01072908.1.p3 GENE.GHVT01072908.1~~GHVT01072908.1.p3  ORF type:complete len:118 (+),score=7.04 GHVT01072908.1:1410-1763(+)